MKLLFVDDSPTVCAIYSALLRDEGYEVIVAAGKTEAMELARQHLPSIAIVDFFMPDGNGDELTRELHADPATANIIVAVHSQFPDVVEKALAAGAVEMIGKDDPHDLFLMRVAALRRLVDGLTFQRQMIGSVRSEMREQSERAVQILLVDDSPTIRAVYGSLLREQGYALLEADSIATATEVAKEHLPQLMIIDYMLPDGHGDQLIRKLLSKQETSDILMVMFSQRQDVEEQALGAGAIDLIYKDDPTDVFLRRIASLKRYINAQQMQRRIEQEVLAQENEMQMRIHDLERVKREKLFVDRLIASIPIGLLVVGGGRVITSNQWFENLFGVIPSENYAFESLLDTLELPVSEVMECGEFSCGRELLAENGKLLRVHCFGIDTAEEDDSNEEVVLWMFEDITQMRRAEEQEQFAAFQSGLVEMSATILHNIGNALTGVTGSLWRVEEGMQQLQKAEQAIKIASGLVDELYDEQLQGEAAIDPRLEKVQKILDLSINQVYRSAMDEIEREALKPMKIGVNHIAEIIQVQQGAARPESQNVPCDLRTVVDDVLVMQDSVLKRSGVVIHRQFEPGLPAPMVPRNQLLQAINNLVKNSYEAITELNSGQEERVDGEITITTSSHADGKRVQLSVTDNGVGLTREQLDKVLQFGYTTKEKGSGFGLHATANFIEGLGGELVLESDGYGEGSRISLSIPLEQIEGI